MSEIVSCEQMMNGCDGRWMQEGVDEFRVVSFHLCMYTGAFKIVWKRVVNTHFHVFAGLDEELCWFFCVRHGRCMGLEVYLPHNICHRVAAGPTPVRTDQHWPSDIPMLHVITAAIAEYWSIKCDIGERKIISLTSILFYLIQYWRLLPSVRGSNLVQIQIKRYTFRNHFLQKTI